MERLWMEIYGGRKHRNKVCVLEPFPISLSPFHDENTATGGGEGELIGVGFLVDSIS